MVRTCLLPALFLLLGAAAAPASQPQFSSVSIGTNGWLRLAGRGESNQVLTLLSSSDLRGWSTAAVLCSEPNFGPEPNAFQFADPTPAAEQARYYRLAGTALQPTNDWRNQVTVFGDPLVSGYTGSGDAGVVWVKFTILLDEPFRIWYQDSSKYLFHYDFAIQRIPRFKGVDRLTFDGLSLRTNNQQAVVGAVLLPSAEATGRPPEFGIQFSGLDAYPIEDIRRWFELVRSTVIAPAGASAFYIPAYEQQATARTHEQLLKTNGIPVDSMERWSSGNNQVYASGWALGQLKFFRASEVASAYQSGLLLPADILVTDAVPIEVPLVAGILTLSPATPNSHVAILAAS